MTSGAGDRRGVGQQAGAELADADAAGERAHGPWAARHRDRRRDGVEAEGREGGVHLAAKLGAAVDMGARVPELLGPHPRGGGPEPPLTARLSCGSESWEDHGVGEHTVHAEPVSAQLAIENERLQRALRARLSEEQALRRVATLVARAHEPGRVLTRVTEEVGRHLNADTAALARYDAPGWATIVALWSPPHVEPYFTVGRQIDLSPQTALGRVRATAAPARVDSYAGMPGRFVSEVRASGIRATVAAPIVADGLLWGAFVVSSRWGPWSEEAEQRLGVFAELVAHAVASVHTRLKLKESRARIVQAADDARRRIERDLHDGAQQRLVGVLISLRLAARAAEPATAAALERCIDEQLAALAELRDLARGLHPAVLVQHGLPSGLDMLAARSPVPVVVRAPPGPRLSPAAETALYFVAAEALTNVAKYAHASAAEVTLRSDGRWAEITIADEGVGGARPEVGGGVRGLCDRVEALGGRLTLASAPAAGTTVRARVPVATESPVITRLA